jgi:hypothetical protein
MQEKKRDFASIGCVRLSVSKFERFLANRARERQTEGEGEGERGGEIDIGRERDLSSKKKD